MARRTPPCSCPHCDHCRKERAAIDRRERQRNRPKPFTADDGRTGRLIHLMHYGGNLPEYFCARDDCDREFILADQVVVFPAASDDEIPTVECYRHHAWDPFADEDTETGPFGATLPPTT